MKQCGTVLNDILYTSLSITEQNIYNKFIPTENMCASFVNGIYSVFIQFENTFSIITLNVIYLHLLYNICIHGHSQLL